MSLPWILRANFLILCLGLSLYVIFQMKNSGLPPSVLAILGFSSPTLGQGGGKSTSQLTWCETRVQSIEKPQSFKIYQSELKWFVSHMEHSGALQASNLLGAPRKIDFLAMEKWFGKHCSLRMTPVLEGHREKNFRTALIVHFIKGTPERLLRQGPNIYGWRGQVFRSPQLKLALNELAKISNSPVLPLEKGAMPE